jgi:hypothetical protein
MKAALKMNFPAEAKQPTPSQLQPQAISQILS